MKRHNARAHRVKVTRVIDAEGRVYRTIVPVIPRPKRKRKKAP